MKPKKNKAGKLSKGKLAGTIKKLCKDEYFEAIQNSGANIPKDDLARMVLASKAFMGSLDRARMNLDGIPPLLIRQTMVHLYQGKPLVFASKGNDFIICDPRTYAQMVGKTGG